MRRQEAVATYTYDSNGNLTTKTEGTDVWGYEWNARNELTRVTKNSVEQARFAYDPTGRRVEKVAGGVTTTYAFDGTAILREVRGSATLKYVHGLGIDEALAVDDGVSLSYFSVDGLGSIAKVTNSAGAVTLTRQYDAWGNLEAGASEPGYAFTGREWDPETAMYYYRARYYDPTIGRFISEDAAGSGFPPAVFLPTWNGEVTSSEISVEVLPARSETVAQWREQLRLCMRERCAPDFAAAKYFRLVRDPEAAELLVKLLDQYPAEYSLVEAVSRQGRPKDAEALRSLMGRPEYGPRGRQFLAERIKKLESGDPCW